jgi:hypothetical protein
MWRGFCGGGFAEIVLSKQTLDIEAEKRISTIG